MKHTFIAIAALMGMATTAMAGDVLMVKSSGEKTMLQLSKEPTMTIGEKITVSDGTTSKQYAASKRVTLIAQPNKVATSVTAVGYSTFVSDWDIDLSEQTSIEAYAAKVDATNSKVVLTKVTAIPADNAVILKAEGGNYSLPVAKSSVAAIANNDLQYSTVSVAYKSGAANTYYILAEESGKAVFAPVTSGTIAAKKGFLKIPNGSEAKSLSLVFDEDAPTAVDTVTGNAATPSGKAYNILGIEVPTTQKGIVIVNGKKVINK